MTVSRIAAGARAPLGRLHPGAVLFATSATVLYVELLLIRWIPANVVYVVRPAVGGPPDRSAPWPAFSGD